jgi:glycosyltransferase involved in cell wall biosynthesis
MITHMENGLLVEPESSEALAQAITRVLSDPELRRGLVEGGYRTLSKYAEAGIMDDIESLYAEVA